MKKFIAFPVVSFILMFSLLLFLIIALQDENDKKDEMDFGGLNVSQDVLKYRPLVEKYAREYDIEEYINYLLAIMEVESGGRVPDVMQCSESLGLPPNSLAPEPSIKQGCYYFSSLLKNALDRGCDISVAVQSYNYGGGFTLYVDERDKKYSLNHAIDYAREKSGGVTVNYSDSIAVNHNGGWRYKYGNMFYVQLVNRYLSSAFFDDETVQAIFAEALKYQGWKYVFGGSNPNTSFDCSGLTSWCYKAAGLNLPRTAQMQYDAMEHIPLSEAKPGDLVFFKGTYNTANYITHVGIYAGESRMYHAGNPIGYADLTTSYWQSHFVSAGRYKN